MSALVQHKAIYPGSSGAFDVDVTAGNLLIVACSSSADTSALTVSDSAGNTWHTQPGLTGYVATLDGSSHKVWYTIANTSGPTTVTISSGPGDFGMTLSEFSGVDGSTPFDMAVFTDVSGTSPHAVSNNLVLSAAGLIVAFFHQERTVGAATPGTGYTRLPGNSGHMDDGEYMTGAVAGTYNPDFTMSWYGPAGATVVAVAFKEAGAAPPATGGLPYWAYNRNNFGVGFLN